MPAVPFDALVWGLAGWGQAGQQHRVAKPHMATMCMGIRHGVKDMPLVQHAPRPPTTQTRICLAFWNGLGVRPEARGQARYFWNQASIKVHARPAATAL